MAADLLDCCPIVCLAAILAGAVLLREYVEEIGGSFMKALSVVFCVLAVLLSDVMCAVAAYNTKS